MVSVITLPIYWFVLTPLVFFLIFIPGYIVVAYVKQKIRKKSSQSTTSRLINKSRVTSYYTSIRPILRDRLQRRSSLNVPTPTKLAPTTKHLRSASTQLPSSPVKSLFQSPSRHHRRSSADSGNFTSSSTASTSPIIIPHFPSIRPDLLEPPYALYQIQPQAGDIELQEPYTTNNKIQLDESTSHKHYFERDSLKFAITNEKDSDENIILTSKKGKKGNGTGYNNNKSEMKDKEKPKKSRHLISPSNHSPFIKKKNTVNSNLTQKNNNKIDNMGEKVVENP